MMGATGQPCLKALDMSVTNLHGATVQDDLVSACTLVSSTASAPASLCLTRSQPSNTLK